VRVQGGGLFSGPRFFLYADGEQPVFLAVAARMAARRGSVKPYYVLSSSEHEQRFDRSSPHFLGRLKGNLLSTHYVVHGPRGATSGAGAGSSEDVLLLDVRFKKPTDAPRAMEVRLPPLRPGAIRTDCRQAWGEVDPGDALFHGSGAVGAEADDWLRLACPKVEYDAESNVYSMNFHGRVSRSSSKNFQLASSGRSFRPLDGAPLCMQFGRVDDNTFHLDVGQPLSPLQAFALALTVFDHRPAEALRMYY